MKEVVKVDRSIKERSLQVVMQAVQRANSLLPIDERSDLTPETALAGQSGGLDSLGLIDLITATEDGMQDEFGVSLSLDDAAADGGIRYFETIQSLTDFVAKCVEKTNSH